MSSTPKDSNKQQANKNIRKKENIQKPKIDYNEKVVINTSFENLIKALVTPQKK